MSTDVVELVTGSTTNFYQCADSGNHWTLVQIGGVNSQTVSYAPVITDAGKLLVMNGSTLTVTLPSPPPSPNWTISIDNINATGLTISRNGLLIDGAASNITLAQNQGTVITTDGTNYFSQRGIGGAALTVPFNNILSGTNTTANMVVSSAAALTPTLDGQSAGNQLWMGPGLPKATLTLNNSGGNILINHNVEVVYTLVTARGETVPSAEVNIATGSSCTGGNQCQVVVTAPTASCGALPCGPYTGYTVYSKDQSSFISGNELQQTASTACVNITTNCTINTGGAGSAFSNTPTAFVQPASLQPTTAGLANGLTPSWFVNDWFNNNTVIQGGMIGATNGNFSTSTFTEIRRHWWNDTGLAQFGSNALLSVYHQSGNFTSTANQDRAISVGHQTVNGSTSGQYSLTGVQSEVDVLATGSGFAITGSPDGEISALSGQVGDTAASNYTASGYGANVARFVYFKNGAGNITGSSDTYNAINAQVQIGNATFSAGSQATVLNATCPNAIGGVISNLSCWGMKFKYPLTANRYANGTAALYIPAIAFVPTAGSDFLIRTDIAGMTTNVNGPIVASQIGTNNVTAFKMFTSASVNGALTMTQASALTITSVSCAGGASQYGYELVGVDGNGGEVASGQVQSASTCVNPLTSGNPATINPSLAFAQQGLQSQFTRVDVYRTAGPMALGKIGSLTCTVAVSTGTFCSTSFSDTGLSASGTVPTVNTTGGITTPANAISHLGGNFAYLDANFTTANNANLQTINGSSQNLVFNLPSNAQVYGYHCALAYSQATAAAAVAFGIQSATVAPNNIFGTGTEQITAGPPATVVTGTLATLATTTGTNIVSGTPGAQGVNYTVYLDGNIDEPANNQGNVINFQVSTAAGADAVTVLKGSYCRLF